MNSGDGRWLDQNWNTAFLPERNGPLRVSFPPPQVETDTETSRAVRTVTNRETLRTWMSFVGGAD